MCSARVGGGNPYYFESIACYQHAGQLSVRKLCVSEETVLWAGKAPLLLWDTPGWRDGMTRASRRRWGEVGERDAGPQAPQQPPHRGLPLKLHHPVPGARRPEAHMEGFGLKFTHFDINRCVFTMLTHPLGPTSCHLWPRHTRRRCRGEGNDR